jgi:hypothetical protein
MNKKIPRATHQGIIKISDDIEIPAYNLETGERVLSRIGFLKAIGRTGKAKGGRKYDDEFKTPVFLSAKNVKPFITSELLENSIPIPFIDMSGNESIGYKAELLPSVCYVFIDAFDQNVLLSTQTHIYEQAKILVRGFAKIGIIALVDEATGYQYDREKDELQKILRAYISEELLPWQKRFPDVFYKELFRLNGWEFTVSGIKKRPGVIGTWTNKLIYDQLPRGVLEELKKKTPKSQSGNYLARFHQNLTLDIGEPTLAAQLNQIITLFQLSDNMQHMWTQFGKLKMRQIGQLELPFGFDEQGHTKEPIYEENGISSFNKKLIIAIENKQGNKGY